MEHFYIIIDILKTALPSNYFIKYYHINVLVDIYILECLQLLASAMASPIGRHRCVDFQLFPVIRFIFLTMSRQLVPAFIQLKYFEVNSYLVGMAALFLEWRQKIFPFSSRAVIRYTLRSQGNGIFINNQLSKNN
jgi:hypothetical protein